MTFRFGVKCSQGILYYVFFVNTDFILYTFICVYMYATEANHVLFSYTLGKYPRSGSYAGTLWNLYAGTFWNAFSDEMNELQIIHSYMMGPAWVGEEERWSVPSELNEMVTEQPPRESYLL